MGAMEGLGRVFNVIPIASGVAVKLKDFSAVSFVCTGADTFTLSIATSFAGTYRAAAFFTPNWNPITKYYQAAATDGTAPWTSVSQAAAAAVVQAGAFTTVFTLLTSAVPDPYTHVKCTKSAAGLVTAVVHDLNIQRKPPNLALLSAA
jgi:hypothetical protein